MQIHVQMKRSILVYVGWLLALGVQAADLWDRPLVIGASVAEGFHHEEFLGPRSRELGFELHLESRILAEHGPIANLGTALMFRDPKSAAARQIEGLKTQDPTVVFAPDFLFWFLYGEIEGGEPARLALLEEGLKTLDSVKAPLVLGDIPDTRRAEGTMLSGPQIPEVETIAVANKRISEWVERKDRVVVLELSKFMERCYEDAGIDFGKVSVTAGSTRAFLQKDLLHPTKPGVQFLAVAFLSSLRSVAEFREDDVNWTPDVLEVQLPKPPELRLPAD